VSSYIHHHIWTHWWFSSVCWTEMSWTTICYHNDATENMIVHSTFDTGSSQLTSRTTVFLQAYTDYFHHAIGNSDCFYAAFDITRKRCFSPAPQFCTGPGICTSHRTTTPARPASLPSNCDVFKLTLSHFSNILINVWFDVMTEREALRLLWSTVRKWAQLFTFSHKWLLHKTKGRPNIFSSGTYVQKLEGVRAAQMFVYNGV